MATRAITLRPEVQAFAEAMERALRRNDHKGGWQDEGWPYLMDRLEEEAAELRAAVKRDRTAATITREAADVANFAMMLADNAQRDARELAEDKPAAQRPSASSLEAEVAVPLKEQK